MKDAVIARRFTSGLWLGLGPNRYRPPNAIRSGFGLTQSSHIYISKISRAAIKLETCGGVSPRTGVRGPLRASISPSAGNTGPKPSQIPPLQPIPWGGRPVIIPPAIFDTLGNPGSNSVCFRSGTVGRLRFLHQIIRNARSYLIYTWLLKSSTTKS